MLNSGVVDVGVALVYVFVLVSVLVSALNELLAGLLKQRAKRAVARRRRADPVRFASRRVLRAPDDHESRTSGVRRAADAADRMTGPSYIPKHVFALTLLDLLQQPHAKLSRGRARAR